MERIDIAKKTLPILIVKFHTFPPLMRTHQFLDKSKMERRDQIRIRMSLDQIWKVKKMISLK